MLIVLVAALAAAGPAAAVEKDVTQLQVRTLWSGLGAGVLH